MAKLQLEPLTRYTWAELIEFSEKHVFGDVLQEDPGRGLNTIVLRGPLRKIYREGDRYVFEALWVAKQDSRGKPSLVQPGRTTISIGTEGGPWVDSVGRLQCPSPTTPTTPWLTLFLKGEEEVRVEDVQGLTGEQKRMTLALRLGLPETASWRVVDEEMARQKT